MKKILVISFYVFVSYCYSSNLVKYVNPLVGSHSSYSFSYGNTYPAIALPWGMNFWSPQTGENKSGWMYVYTDSIIRGFRQTHQPSPWINDYGTFSIMPLVDSVILSDKDRMIGFSHSNEISTPYYYRVKMNNGITTEISPTERAAMFRINYPATAVKYLVVDAFNKGSMLHLDSNRRRLTGYSKYNNGGVPSNFANYFVLEFNYPVKNSKVYYNGKESDLLGEGDHVIASLQFEVPTGATLQIRTASSFISPAQAELNFSRELGKRSFDEIREQAKVVWNKALGRIEIEDENVENKRVFYSCLYRTLLFPRMFYEFDKDNHPMHYSPYNGKVSAGYMYTDNGFWDTFRAVHPFFTLVFPEVSERIVQSLVTSYKESGFLPEWMSPGHRECMIGNNSVSLITDAWMKGIRNFDSKTALEAMLKSTNAQGPYHSVGRDGFKEYNRLGFVPYPDFNEASAKTLEYAYADWCVSRFAGEMSDSAVQGLYARKAMNYKNLFDKNLGFMRAKDKNGQWIEPFYPIEWGGPFTEGSSWHYTWSVFHDPEGLAQLMGGRLKMGNRLDSMFSSPPTFKTGKYGTVIHEMTEMVALNMGQYAHGNQPVQHAIYLYDYAQQPWKAQSHLREVMTKLYNSTPKGYCGDEDNGQTSAWYVFSAMGFYPVCPGQPEYVIGSPLFKQAKINFSNGKSFVINTQQNNSQNVYVNNATLNGNSFTRSYISHKEIISGGELNFTMSNQPNKKRGILEKDVPYSFSLKR